MRFKVARAIGKTLAALVSATVLAGAVVTFGFLLGFGACLGVEQASKLLQEKEAAHDDGQDDRAAP